MEEEKKVSRKPQVKLDFRRASRVLSPVFEGLKQTNQVSALLLFLWEAASEDLELKNGVYVLHSGAALVTFGVKASGA